MRERLPIPKKTAQQKVEGTQTPQLDSWVHILASQNEFREEAALCMQLGVTHSRPLLWHHLSQENYQQLV